MSKGKVLAISAYALRYTHIHVKSRNPNVTGRFTTSDKPPYAYRKPSTRNGHFKKFFLSSFQNLGVGKNSNVHD